MDIPGSGLTSRTSSILMPGEYEKEEARRKSDEFVIPIGTNFVRADLLQVALEIRRLWPELDVVQCGIGHDCMGLGHYPFMVVEHTRAGKTYPVIGVEKLDNTVIENLWKMHKERMGIEQVKKQMDKAKEEQRKKRVEQRREGLEVVEAALKSRKLRWRGPGGKVMTDTGERVV